MPTILIIEDEKRVADLLKAGLEENGFQTIVAYDGAMGLRLFRAGGVQLVISDIILPKMDGFELCKEIRKQDSQVPILMLTALGSTDDKLEGFDAGADDYMVKPFDFRELNARVQVLLKRKADTPAATPDSIAYAGLVIDLRRQEATRDGIAIKLSPKEYNLLRYMVENPERVISRVEIAEKVWNTHFDTGTNFIDVYINYLRKKIDRDFDQKLIHTKPGIGFILTDKPYPEEYVCHRGGARPLHAPDLPDERASPEPDIFPRPEKRGGHQSASFPPKPGGCPHHAIHLPEQ
jgi:DNA-binding response OmpR family regulator